MFPGNTEMNAKKILKYGEVTEISCGNMNIRVYDTKDAIEDKVIILDKGGRGAVIELPAFHSNIEELTGYLRDEGLEIEGKIVSYHAAGKTFLPEVRNYMTEDAVKYNTVGGGAALVGNFTRVFGPGFDSSTVTSGEDLRAGRFSIAGIDLIILPDGEAYEVAIPEAKAVYMHMLGHDCHSIVAGPAHADAIVSRLRKYLDDGYDMFLSAHYMPEGRSDVEVKIAYLEDLKEIAGGCSSSEEFAKAVNGKYPGYSGGNYLDITAGLFFQK